MKDNKGSLARRPLTHLPRSPTNPFRQVQYVVLRAQRYSAYELVDLRLSAINLYAGHETEVEDFEEGDGTLEGTLSDAERLFIDASMESAMSLPTMYWTGWWPTFHFLIDWNPFGDLCLCLHITIDLLLNVNVALDGMVSLIVPFLESIGLVGDAAVQETLAAVARLQAFHDVMNPWNNSDILAGFTMLTGIWAFSSLPATIVWAASLALWWISIANAVLVDYNAMLEGKLERYDVGLQCIQKGLLQYAALGMGGIGIGIVTNQGQNERIHSEIAEELTKRNPLESLVNDIVATNVAAGAIQMLTGFVLAFVGILIWSGL